LGVFWSACPAKKGGDLLARALRSLSLLIKFQSNQE
jgi:hypothetical protein